MRPVNLYGTSSLLENSKKSVLIEFFDAYGDHWQIIDLEDTNPEINIAIEETLLKLVGEEQLPQIIRLWRNPKSVVIGRFQCVNWETNLDVCRKFGITVHKRFTGGGAVYHDLGNLNWTICCRRDSPLVPNEVFRIPEQFSIGVVNGIRALGLDAEYEPRGTYIHVKQKKVSGLASAIKNRAVLLHGTLLVHTNLQMLKTVLQVPSEPKLGFSRKKGPKYVRSNRREVTTLEKELGRKVPVLEVKKQLCSSFRLYLRDKRKKKHHKEANS